MPTSRCTNLRSRIWRVGLGKYDFELIPMLRGTVTFRLQRGQQTNIVFIGFGDKPAYRMLVGIPLGPYEFRIITTKPIPGSPGQTQIPRPPGSS